MPPQYHQPMMPQAHEQPGTKLFVGQLPFSKTESDLWQLFGSIGPLAEVVLMVDSKTNKKKGAAFVRYHNVHSANAAVAALDGFLFSGSPRPISVSISASGGGQKRGPPSAAAAFATIQSMGTQAAGALNVTGGMQAPGQGHAGMAGQDPGGPAAKLFVGQLPFSRSEMDIKAAFSKYGPVAEVFIHKDAQGQKKGGAFVKFFNEDHAAQALEMDGFVFDGATRAISVAVAGESAKRQRME
jgi:RNA recognition motif-containing protein